MGGRGAVAIGLVAGIVVGAAAIGGAIVLLPGPSASPSAPPVGQVSPSPSAAPPASASPAPPSPSAPSSPSPNTSAAASPPASPGGSGEANFGVGEPAPVLRVARLGGGEIDLANLRGKPVWVNFMATWCPSCRDELPLMAGFAVRYADTGLVVLAIDVKEDEAAVNAYLQELGVTFPVGLDRDAAAQQAWGAYALPVHFWVDKDGIVRDGAFGGIGPDIMAAGLESILPGVDVTP
jgi:thiol-disulfide isomerase/thioredoxin